MTFVLTLEAVKTAAREAYAKGELGFQKGEERCLYRGASGAPCAVGAALPPEVIDTLVRKDLNETRFARLVCDDHLVVAEGDKWAISAIQTAHDAIINVARTRRLHPDEICPSEEELVGRLKSLIGAE